jgi:hypothetical protein
LWRKRVNPPNSSVVEIPRHIKKNFKAPSKYATKMAMSDWFHTNEVPADFFKSKAYLDGGDYFTILSVSRPNRAELMIDEC